MVFKLQGGQRKRGGKRDEGGRRRIERETERDRETYRQREESRKRNLLLLFLSFTRLLLCIAIRHHLISNNSY